MLFILDSELEQSMYYFKKVSHASDSISTCNISVQAISPFKFFKNYSTPPPLASLPLPGTQNTKQVRANTN